MLQRMHERLADAGGLGFAKTHPSAKSRADTLSSTISSAEFVPDKARKERFSVVMQPILAGG